MIHFLAEKEKSNNRDTRLSWERYANHRQKMMGLIDMHTGEKQGSICLLGAGNCNDIELPHLLNTFDSVTLVDLDPNALEFGISQQGVKDHPKLRVLSGVDLSGILAFIEAWQTQTASNQEKERCLHTLHNSRPLAAFHGKFDLVISCCLLSQMILTITHTKLSHKEKQHLIQLLRNQHLGQLLQLTKASGNSLFATDVLSSDTLAAIQHPDFLPSPDLLSVLAKERKLFPGLNPFGILRDIHKRFPGAVQTFLSDPWVWHLSEEAEFSELWDHGEKKGSFTPSKFLSFASDSKVFWMPEMSASGLKEILSIPFSTRKWVNSCESLAACPHNPTFIPLERATSITYPTILRMAALFSSNRSLSRSLSLSSPKLNCVRSLEPILNPSNRSAKSSARITLLGTSIIT